jgi:hypothetical protein
MREEFANELIVRHGRTCSGHTRLCLHAERKTWWPATQASEATPFYERLGAGMTKQSNYNVC